MSGELREAITEAIEAGQQPRARRLLAQLWQSRPGPALAGFVASTFAKLDAFTPVEVPVFLLRSCTFEPVVPVLRAQGLLNGLDIQVKVGDFNAYAQEILDPSSSLYAEAPKAAILAVHTADIAPELWERFADLEPDAVAKVIDRVLSDFRTWLRVFRERSQAHLVVHDLEVPAQLAHGVLDDQMALGQAEAIRRINTGLRALAAEYTGVYVLGYDALVARHGRAQWHDASKWASMRMPMRVDRVLPVAEEWLRFLHPVAGRVCKVLVCDLDNTLWGGVIGEDGLKGIKLGKDAKGAPFRDLQRAILDLHQRGVVLAICSKNNEADALEAITQHPEMLLRPSHFAALRINWEDKAHNIRSIAHELNVGIDSLAFIDDNPAERALVAEHVPEVTVLELPEDAGRYAELLRSAPFFERLTLSAEDRQRGRYYAQKRQTEALQAEATSLEDYYRSLEIRVHVEPLIDDTIARAAQLTQKTNQFNLTTRRYSEQEVQTMQADPAWRLLSLRAADRFGDNGLVGVAFVRSGEAAWELDTLLMSCRVIGRTIETALLSSIAKRARLAGAKQLLGSFIPTAKNAPCKDVLRDHGFRCVDDDASHSRWSLALDGDLPACPEWIECHDEE